MYSGSVGRKQPLISESDLVELSGYYLFDSYWRISDVGWKVILSIFMVLAR